MSGQGRWPGLLDLQLSDITITSPAWSELVADTEHECMTCHEPIKPGDTYLWGRYDSGRPGFSFWTRHPTCEGPGDYYAHVRPTAEPAA